MIHYILFINVSMKSFFVILFSFLLRISIQLQANSSTQLTTEKQVNPCVIVVFGATGDLTARKLLPALYNLAYEGNLPENIAIVGFARGAHSHETFRERMGEAINQFSRTKPINTNFWQHFQNKIFYNQSSFEQDLGYENLHKLLEEIDQKFGTQGNRIFYLATSPSHFSTIIKKLDEHKLIYHFDNNQKQWSRVIIEKPFGTDLSSAINLQKEISIYLDENQVYLMDHYLGKEGVQNLFTLRFENALFEPLWNKEFIDHIQITLSEEIGIGTRAQFCEETGALRDVFQNHLLQLLAIIAMEPPLSLSSAHIHEEKIKVLNAIRPFSLNEIDNDIVRGQYSSGEINGKKVLGYKQENGVPENSSAETFVAVQLFIDNTRWKGVPFYIRGGKRLPKQTTEIVITFKNHHSQIASNVLFIRIQPNPSIFLKMVSKVPMLNKSVEPVLFGYSTEKFFNKSSMEAYEKLIYDCIQGDHSLYVNVQEQFATWCLLTPVLNYWKSFPEKIQNYDAGTWGPTNADQMLRNSGHQWQLLEIINR